MNSSPSPHSTLPTATTSLPDPTNPIHNNYQILNYIGSCGPEYVWKLFEGYRIHHPATTSHGHHHHAHNHPAPDRKQVTVFFYEKRMAEKLHKPKRKETIAEILRSSHRQLERFRHPKILNIQSSLEESQESLAFATEPLRGCLSQLMGENFLDLELKYGLLQVTEALQFLHYSGHVIHRNVCPNSIVVTKRGVWKLAGMEFVEKSPDSSSPSTSNLVDPLVDPLPVTPWSSRLPKMGQPELDYIAPEIQTQSNCSILSDMYSLGLLICYIYNGGQGLVRAKYSSSAYLKQVEQLDSELSLLLPAIPSGLQEAISRLLSREPRLRPTSQLLSLIKHFADPVVHALQYLDVIAMKDPVQKAGFYRNGLMQVLPYVPRKLWFAHVWPVLQLELRTTEVLAAALQPILYLVKESTQEEFDKLLLPPFKYITTTPKSIQASVTLLENMHTVLGKCGADEDLKREMLAFVYGSFDSGTVQVQNAALIATTYCAPFIPTVTMRTVLLPKHKQIYSKHATDVRVHLNVLSSLERNLDKLERASIVEEVLPMLVEAKLQDADVCWRVVQIYRLLLSSKQYGLSFNLLATRVIPSLTPQTINPSLSLEQFTCLMETVQEMLECIERNQRNKLKLDCLSPGMGSRRGSEAVQQGRDGRKASSAEDVKGGGLLGADHQPHSLSTSTTPTSDNFLRVTQQQPAYRRLSDNALLPTIKLSVDELPIRRHSSTGPEQQRKSSMAAVVREAVRPTSASASAVNVTASSASSRRQSTVLPASNLLSQLGTGIGAFLHKNIPR